MSHINQLQSFSPAKMGHRTSALLLVVSVIAAAGAARITSRLPVQLCRCDPTVSAWQSWEWGSRVNPDGQDPTTTPQQIKLKADPSKCLVVGPKLPSLTESYLFLDECDSAAPKFWFQWVRNGSLGRDAATLTDGSLCLDADAMSAHLQLYPCIDNDNDQQYAAVDGYGLIVDLWTGNENCVGVVSGGNGLMNTTCPPPQGTHPDGPRPKACNAQGGDTGGKPSNWLSPLYHLNDGGQKQSDPSGCIEIGGTWFVFPDQSVACDEATGKRTGGVFTSTDLVHWTRRPTNIRFYETGGITVVPSTNGTPTEAFTFGGGGHWTNVQTDPYLQNWRPIKMTGADPHAAGRGGEQPATRGDDPHSGLFRVGDPSTAFSNPVLRDGRMYMVLGGGRNATAANNITQGELRLVRSKVNDYTAWEYVGVAFASNETAGLWAAPISNMFECPDFFPIGNSSKWMFVTSQIFQGHRWVTGGNHHWDQYRIGTFNGTTFVPEHQGVLDYGYVAAGKTGGNWQNGPTGRRVFFGWNMPWSRQGAHGAEGPVLGPDDRVSHRRGSGHQLGHRLLQNRGNRSVTWPESEPFGSQILPRDLSLFPDGSLKMVPVPELASLREPGGPHFQSSRRLESTTTCVGINGTQLELIFDVVIGTGAVAGASVTVMTNPDRSERTLIGANATHLIVDQSNSTLTPDLTPAELERVTSAGWRNAWVSNHSTLLAPVPEAKTHHVHVFLDGSNLEVFADERVAITTNLFPTKRGSICVGVDVSGGGSIDSLVVYRLLAAPVAGVSP